MKNRLIILVTLAVVLISAILFVLPSIMEQKERIESKQAQQDFMDKLNSKRVMEMMKKSESSKPQE